MILSGIVVTGAIAFGTGYFFLNVQPEQQAWQAYSTESTRVSDPGHNLVGQNWTGDLGNVLSGDSEKTPS
ncbi:hypothetical protein [Mesorhizobium sp. Root157]|uniref:hypothetical protein n=1 Tax=Mesorhizobium sp. Root157 TaxID=1736477 RepID=UPI000A751940|nr:hypothetical protein [Mesorhizobium sp. Root157]